jgi:hypothetical protein
LQSRRTGTANLSPSQVRLISNSDLSKESENPVTRLIMLPLRYEGEFQDGAPRPPRARLKSIKRWCHSG